MSDSPERNLLERLRARYKEVCKETDLACRTKDFKRAVLLRRHQTRLCALMRKLESSAYGRIELEALPPTVAQRLTDLESRVVELEEIVRRLLPKWRAPLEE